MPIGKTDEIARSNSKDRTDKAYSAFRADLIPGRSISFLYPQARQGEWNGAISNSDDASKQMRRKTYALSVFELRSQRHAHSRPRSL